MSKKNKFEIETEFIMMLNEKGFSGEKRKALLKLPTVNKLLLIQQHSNNKQNKRIWPFGSLNPRFSGNSSGNPMVSSGFDGLCGHSSGPSNDSSGPISNSGGLGLCRGPSNVRSGPSNDASGLGGNASEVGAEDGYAINNQLSIILEKLNLSNVQRAEYFSMNFKEKLELISSYQKHNVNANYNAANANETSGFYYAENSRESSNYHTNQEKVPSKYRHSSVGEKRMPAPNIPINNQNHHESQDELQMRKSTTNIQPPKSKQTEDLFRNRIKSVPNFQQYYDPPSNVKDFLLEKEFEAMLNEKEFEGQQRKTLMDLPDANKRLLIEQYKKENSRKSGFWGRFSTSKPASRSSVIQPKKNSNESLNNIPNSNINNNQVSSKSTDFNTNTEFIMMLNSRQIVGKQRETMMLLPIEKKRELVEQHKKQNEPRSSIKELFGLGKRKLGSKEDIQMIMEGNLNAPSSKTEAVQQHNPKSTIKKNTTYPLESPAWFIFKLSNRNETLKPLMKTLVSLKNVMLLSGREFVTLFVSTVIPNHGVSNLNGISALEIAMDRICLPTHQNQSTSLSRLQTTKFKNGGNLYADSVFLDEIRIECINCVEIVMNGDYGLSAVAGSRGLLRQILWSFHVPTKEIQNLLVKDARLRRAYLILLTSIGRLLGAACMVEERIKEHVLSIFKEMQAHQGEPFAFFFLISSLTNPFQFSRSANILEKEAALNLAYLVDYEEIWNYRTALLILLNGLVSSSDTLSERIRVRRMLESCGLRGILQKLVEGTPSEEFKLQFHSYNEDRENDENTILNQSKTKNAEKAVVANNLSNDSIALLFDTIEKLEDPSLARHFVNGAVTNITEILKGINEKKDTLGAREDLGNLLWLIEQSTRALAKSVKQSIDENNPTVQLMQLVEADYIRAVETSLKSIMPTPPKEIERREKNIRELVAELHQVRANLEAAQKEAKDAKKEIELMQISKMRENKPKLITTDQEKGETRIHSLDGETARDSKLLEFFATYGGNKIDAQVLEKYGGAAGVGILWNEVQRLEREIRNLEKEKFALLEKEKPEEKKLQSNIPVSIPASVPPPPPPPAPGNISETKNNIKTSQIPMKALSWTKLSQQESQNSIWSKLFENAYENPVINEEELIKQFSINSEGEKNMADFVTPTTLQNTKISFIEQRVKQNIEIMMIAMKASGEDFRDAILLLDDEFVTLERLVNLKQLIPSPEIMELISNVKNSEDLAVPEYFMRKLNEVPRLRERIDVMIFRQRFLQEVPEIEPDIFLVKQAIEQLKKSEKFSKILQKILVIGNFLNGRSFRGGAYGFKLESLLNIHKTKSAFDNSVGSGNLLNFIAREIDEDDSSLLDFFEDMPAVGKVQFININNLLDGVKDLLVEFEVLKNEVKVIKQIGAHEGDYFLCVFEPFVKEASQMVPILKLEAESLVNELVSLYEYFGEDFQDRKNEPQILFEYIIKFNRFLQVAITENQMVKKKHVKHQMLGSEDSEVIENDEQPPDQIVYDSESSLNSVEPIGEGTLELSSILMQGVPMAEARKTMRKVKSKNLLLNLPTEDSSPSFSSGLNSILIQDRLESSLHFSPGDTRDPRSILSSVNSFVE